MIIIPSFISEELFIINAFNKKQEEQIESFTNNIEDHIEKAEIERWVQTSEPDGIADTDEIEHIAGVSEEDYDIREMFSAIMPLYQRQAMLITIWSAFECELENMYLYAAEKINGTTRLSRKPNRDSKINHILNELKAIGIAETTSENFKSAFATLNLEVREVRNAWAHNGGKDLKNITNDGVDGLSLKYQQIAISKDYIQKVVALIRTVSSELNPLIRQKVSAANRVAGGI
ncbi:hypothetical protein [Shewanella sp. 0m-4]